MEIQSMREKEGRGKYTAVLVFFFTFFRCSMKKKVSVGLMRLFFFFLLLLSDRFESVCSEKEEKKKMNRSFIQRLSRFRMKWNRCSHSLVFITPCLDVWERARARSRIERKKRGEIVRICSFARLAHQQQARRRRIRISQGRSISLLAQIQTHEQFIPDCFFLLCNRDAVNIDEMHLRTDFSWLYLLSSIIG